MHNLSRRSLFLVACSTTQMCARELANEQVRVPARGYSWWTFQGRAGQKIVGRFEASGGDNNDIEVIAGQKDEVLNALNGHGGRLLFNSGKRTSGKFEVEIPAPEEYALALNNRFSIISNKFVRIKADVS